MKIDFETFTRSAIPKVILFAIRAKQCEQARDIINHEHTFSLYVVSVMLISSRSTKVT